MVALRSADGAGADLYLHGAHVTSWRPAPGATERLFLSSRSVFRAGAAIRGGIPVIFPQFAAEGPLPRHGFARTSDWTLDGIETTAAGQEIATLSLRDSPATQAVWKVRFNAVLTVRVGGDRLAVTLAVENPGRESFAFTCALHSYLRVHHVADAQVVGLQGVRYRESGTPGHLQRDAAGVVSFPGALDRVYVDVPRELVLREPDRALRIELEGLPDAVLWNPGATAAAALPDFTPGEERSMLCVEGGAVQHPVTLTPGARWQGTQTLVAVEQT